MATVTFDSVAADAGRYDERIDSIEVAARHLVDLVLQPGVEPVGVCGGVLLDLQVGHVRCRLELAAPLGVPPPGGPLSPRETEVARMVAQGYPNKTIAAVLEISSFTVSSYLRRIFAKLGVNSRAAMVAQALENHLLSVPPTSVETAGDRPSRIKSE